MAQLERRTNFIGIAVVMLAVFISVVSCNSTESVTVTSTWSSSSLTNFTVVNSTLSTTTVRSPEMLRRTTSPSSAQTTSCVLAELDPFQQKIIQDKVERFSLIEYLLVFPNNSVNPLKHNMKHIFKVCSLIICHLRVRTSL